MTKVERPAISRSQRLEDAVRAAGVERGRRLVEDEDGGVAQQRPRDGDRWAWPPDSRRPRSPTRVSYPSGSAAMNASASAARAAAWIGASDASGRP